MTEDKHPLDCDPNSPVDGATSALRIVSVALGATAARNDPPVCRRCGRGLSCYGEVQMIAPTGTADKRENRTNCLIFRGEYRCDEAEPYYLCPDCAGASIRGEAVALAENWALAGATPDDDECREAREGLDGYPPFHAFLYALAQEMKPRTIVEVGTDKGRGALHLARGAPTAKVTTIDPNGIPMWTTKCRNVTFLAKRSEHVYWQFEKIDLLFVDGGHTYEQAKLDYDLYMPRVSPGGLAVFDDIHLDDGMRRFWEEIKRPKIALEIGEKYSGFGVVFP